MLIKFIKYLDGYLYQSFLFLLSFYVFQSDIQCNQYFYHLLLDNLRNLSQISQKTLLNLIDIFRQFINNNQTSVASTPSSLTMTQKQTELKQKLIIEPHHESGQGSTQRNHIMQQQEQESDDEEQIRRKQQIEKLEKQIKKKQATAKANNKVFVGSGFSFDITQFFKFKKQKQLVSTGDDVKTVFQELSGGHLSWIILIYSVCNAAMIPAWIMSIKATKLLRISWRFLLQAIMIIPFVLYERRKADAQTLEKYKLSYIFNFEHLYIAYLSSFATSFWFTIILTTFEWSFISHTMFLGALANYFLSIGRTMRGNGHDLEPGGQVLITIGILMVLIDIYQFNPQHDAKPEDWHFINPWYLTRSRIESVLADLIALGVSYFMSKFSVYTADLKNHYPPFLSMLLVNSMVCINMMFTTYFFNGATYDHDPFWGILSIFSQKHFAAFMYMAIILCMGLVISFVMISNLFPDPIIPSLAMTFQPAISTLLLYLAGVQTMPPALSFLGYILIIPGNFLILIGQWMFQIINKQKKQEQQNRITKLIELSEQKRKSLKRISQRKSQLSSQREQQEEMTLNKKKRKNSMTEKLKQIKEGKQKEIEMTNMKPPPASH